MEAAMFFFYSHPNFTTRCHYILHTKPLMNVPLNISRPRLCFLQNTFALTVYLFIKITINNASIHPSSVTLILLRLYSIILSHKTPVLRNKSILQIEPTPCRPCQRPVYLVPLFHLTWCDKSFTLLGAPSTVRVKFLLLTENSPQLFPLASCRTNRLTNCPGCSALSFFTHLPSYCVYATLNEYSSL